MAFLAPDPDAQVRNGEPKLLKPRHWCSLRAEADQTFGRSLERNVEEFHGSTVQLSPECPCDPLSSRRAASALASLPLEVGMQHMADHLLIPLTASIGKNQNAISICGRY